MKTYTIISLLLAVSSVCGAQGRMELHVQGFELQHTAAGEERYEAHVGDLGTIELVLTNIPDDVVDAHVAIPGLEHVTVNSRGTSSVQQVTMINGVTSKEIKRTISLQMLLKQPGEFVIGPVQATVDGAVVRSNQVRFAVKPAMPGGSMRHDGQLRPLFAQLTASKTKVVVGEPFMITCSLFTSEQVLDAKPAMEQLQDVELRQDIPPRKRQQTIDGKLYNVLDVFLSVIPLREGEIIVPPFTWQVSVPDHSRQRGAGMMMSALMQGFLGGVHQKQVVTNELTITVEPLPLAHESVDGVGEFTKFAAHLEHARCAVGELVSLRLTVHGRGNFEYIRPIELQLPSTLTAFEPTVTEDLDVIDGMQVGTKTFEYMLRARTPGAVAIPAQSFHFFDTATRTYKSIMSDAVDLQVTGRDAASAPLSPEPAVVPVHAPVAPSKPDIHHIIEHQAASRASRVLRLPWWLLIALCGAPLVYVAGERAWRAWGISGKLGKKRQLHACRERLRACIMSANDEQVLCSAFKDYLVLRMGVSRAQLDDASLRAYLVANGWLPERIAEYIAFFDQGTAISFSMKVLSPAEKKIFFERAQRLFEQLENK